MGLNLEAVSYYLSYKHVPTPMSAIKGKSRVSPINVAGIKFSPTIEMGENEVADKLDGMLRHNIGKVLRENEGIGFLTSGGIDSGVITAIGAEMSGKPIRTYSLVYKDLDTEGKNADKEYSRLISEIYNTEHMEIEVSLRDYRDSLVDMLKCFGEPFSGYMTVYLIAREVRKYVKSVLTGDWADELFGSYRTHRLAHQNDGLNPWVIRYDCLVFKDEEKQKLCNGWSNWDTLEHLKSYSENLTAKDPLNRMLESELHSVFIDQTYLSIDVLSKRHSLDVIGGYSFGDVVDFTARLPAHMKMRAGETKHALKLVAKRYLPDSITYRKKEGFITPTLNLVLSLEDYIREMLGEKHLKKHGLFNIEYVDNLVDGFYKHPSENVSYKIWNLFSFQVWYEID